MVMFALNLREGLLLTVPASLGLLGSGGFACGGAGMFVSLFPVNCGFLGALCCVRGGSTWGVPLSRVSPVLFRCRFSELRKGRQSKGMGARQDILGWVCIGRGELNTGFGGETQSIVH